MLISFLRVSKKAAAAVYAARIVMFSRAEEEKEMFERWTPTLAYYTGYGEEDVSTLALQVMNGPSTPNISCTISVYDFLYDFLHDFLYYFLYDFLYD
jgi:hypothetical protein